MSALKNLNFDNSYSQLGEYFSVRLDPDGFENPKLVAFNSEAAALLDLNSDSEPADLCRYFGGQENLPGSEPVSMVYAGHQFGGYSSRLGDGRGLLLGEVVNSQGERWDLHLKGAGLTPFSRMGDGRAVLRSVIREYLGSEAMHHLGVPSTRAMTIITSDHPVHREKVEAGTMMLRLAKSHIRFGHFEFFFYSGQKENLRRLLDYTIKRDFPGVEEGQYKEFFRTVCMKTADLIAKWQAHGFTHGVMNTDNMSIIGDTFDYGPYGFMDDYEERYIPNHSDTTGRYSFENQPSIAMWNLRCLGYALQDFILEEEAEEICNEYVTRFKASYFDLLLQKFGLARKSDKTVKFALESLELLEKNKVDYPLFFRSLSEFIPGRVNAVKNLFGCRKSFLEWENRYIEFLEAEESVDSIRQESMRKINPCYVLRNYLLQNAIEKAEKGDYSEIENLLKIARSPYRELPGMEKYQEPPPDWGKHLIISCSS